jgi:CHAT domain-containing protein/Tfp pilus assembly protein PilF
MLKSRLTSVFVGAFLGISCASPSYGEAPEAATVAEVNRLLEMGRVPEARKAVDAIVAKNGKSAELLALRARVLAGSDAAGALADADEAVRLDRESAMAHASRSTALRFAKRYDDALAAAEKAVALDPQSPRCVLNRGLVRWSLGKLPEAHADMEAAIKLDEKFASASLARIALLYQESRFEDALTECNRCLKVRPDLAGVLHMRRGETLEKLARSDDALAAYRRACEADLKDPKPHAKVADLLKARGELVDALAAYDEAVRLTPPGSNLNLLLARADAHTKRSAPEPALADLDVVLKADPKNAWGLRYRANVYFVLKRYDESKADLDALVTLLPQDAAALVDRARTLWAGGDVAAAEADFAAAKKLNPQYAVPYQTRMSLLMGAQKWEQAAQECADLAVAIPAKAAEALLDRSANLQQLGHLDEALADAQSAFQKSPAWALAARRIAELQKLRGDHVAATLAYDDAVRLAPHDMDHRLWRGETLVKVGRYADALADFDAVLKADSKNSWALRFRTRALIPLRRYDDALANVNDLLALLPGDAGGLCDRGYVYSLKADLAKAEADFTASIAADPRYEVPLKERARVRTQLGRRDDAWADAEKLLELNKNSADVRLFRARVLLNQTKEGEPVDFERALVELNVALELQPSPAAYSERGNIYAFFNRFDDARRDYEAGLKLDPKNADLLARRGALTFQQGLPDKALPDLDEAARLAPEWVLPYYIRSKVRSRLSDSAGSEQDWAMVAKLDPKLLTSDAGPPQGAQFLTEDDDALLRRWSREGKFAEAAALLERKLAAARADKNAPPFLVPDLLEDLADQRALLGEHEEALRLTDEQLALEIKTFGEKHDRVAQARVQKEYITAVAKFSPTELERLRRKWSKSATANDLAKDRRYAEAFVLAKEAQAESAALFRDDSPSAWFAKLLISECLEGLRRHEEAEKLQREIAARLTRFYGMKTEAVLAIEYNAAWMKWLRLSTADKDMSEVLAAALDIATAKRQRMEFSAGDPAITDERRSKLRQSFLTDGRVVVNLAEKAGDLKAAETMLTEMLAVAKQEFAVDDGRVKSLDFEVRRFAKMQTLSPEDRRELRELTKTAGDHMTQRRYVEALAAQREVAEKWRELLGERHPMYAEQLHYVAHYTEAARGDPKEIEENYRRALELRRELLGSQHTDVAATLSAFADFLCRIHRREEAIPLFAEACRIQGFNAGDTSYERAEALEKLVYAAAELHDQAMVEREGLELLRVRRETSGTASAEYADAAIILSNHYESVGKLREAVLYTEFAVAALRQMSPVDYDRLAAAMVSRAARLWSRGDAAATEAQFRECLELCEKHLGAAHTRTLLALHEYAVFNVGRDHLVEAEAQCRRGLEQARAAEKPSLGIEARFLEDLGGIRMQIGDLPAARRLLQESLDLKIEYFGAKSDPVVEALTMLARTYIDTPEVAKAGPLLERAHKTCEEMYGQKHPATLDTFIKLGLYLMELGALPPENEIPFYQGVLGAYIKWHGHAHRKTQQVRDLLAMIYWKSGKYDNAAELLRVVLETKRQTLGESHTGTAGAHFAFARLYTSAGRYREAAEYCRAAAAVFRPYLEAAAAGLSEREQIAMTRQTRAVVDVLLSAAVAEPQEAAAAYDVMLDWKGMVWVRRQLLRAANDQPELLPLFEQLQHTTAELARRSLATTQPDETQLTANAELAAKKEQLERELFARSAAFRKSRQAVTAADLSKVLDADTVLVDLLEYRRYFAATKDEPGMGSDRRSYLAVVVRHEGAPIFVDLGDAAPIIAAIDVWREHLGRGAKGEGAAKQLRTAIWEPLEKHLGDIPTVLVSPDGALGKFPFAALPGAKPDTFLIEERAVVVVPVPQALPSLLSDQAGAARADMKDLLLIGDVDYGSTTAAKPEPSAVASSGPRKGISRLKRAAEWKAFEPLDGAAAEITVISKLFHDDKTTGFQVTMLDKDRAREERFIEEAPRHRYLHAATHGFFAPPSLTQAGASGEVRASGSPTTTQDAPAELPPGLLSGLALAGANLTETSDAADGILTADEVQTLDLRGVEMAVLSACESGLGTVAGGEGVLGLQRAFQVAGARTTITSLWKVDDAQTQVLMTRMYRNLLKEGLGTFEALREAQLWMLREGPRRDVRLKAPGADVPEADRSPPYYWAPFVLSGDWR